MEFFGKTNIDFISKRKIFFYVSTAINVLGILLAFVLPLRFGIDFVGGTEVGVRFSQAESIELVREAINKAGFQNAEIKSYGSANEYLVRVKESKINDVASADVVKTQLTKVFPQANPEIRSVNTIGAKIGSEARWNALIAVLLSIIAIMIYIAFRFEFIYGLGAVIALVHDVIVAFTFVQIGQMITPLNLEINQGVLAALLTVVGFSINDTVIIFDRIRENKELHKGLKLIDLINLSLNETLSRTINTVLTVVLVLATILALGGEALQGFSFTMLIGIITGAYSSIYVASAFVVWYMETVQKKDVHSVHH